MITVVTAYVPIPGHPRDEATYRELGQRLLDLDIPLMTLEGDLDNCWLFRYLDWRKQSFTHSVDDNPAKNSISYHIVQSQKSEWLVDAAFCNPDADVLVWIDYGIFHVPGMTGKIIKDFLARAADEQAIAIPGCWDRGYNYDDSKPCWRFCGGVLVVPQKYVIPFDIAMKREYVRWLNLTDNLSWEVNTMARMEQREPDLPIWQYRANHDVSIFTNYQSVENADSRYGLN